MLLISFDSHQNAADYERGLVEDQDQVYNISTPSDILIPWAKRQLSCCIRVGDSSDVIWQAVNMNTSL